MKKYRKLIIAAIIALIFIGTFVFLWQKSQPKEIVYSEFTPKLDSIQKTTIITGKIEPRNEVYVKPQISGIITEILKEAGDYVQAGEVIAKVKVIPDMGSLSNAEARVRLADINLEQAKVDYDREKNLYDQKLVSADEFDKVSQQLRQAKHELSAATDALQVVRDGFSKSNASASSTLIRSTISGVILDIPVKVGNSVINSNTFNDGTTIASVANMNDLIFRGNIDETEVGQLKIRSGYSANAEIVLARADKVLTIPESAIEFSGDSTFVYVLTDSTAEKNYDRRYVETGLSDGVNIEIKKGLTDKDKVRGPEIITDDNKED